MFQAQTPQPLKHKIAAADLQAPNSEPQPKHKKLNEELSDEEFEVCLLLSKPCKHNTTVFYVV